ncbi:MAG: 2-phospho-L-lactate guanylyltransferase [Solirubrobacteraceae bacterium]
MATLAILPVKSFAAANQRLEHELTEGTRRALAEAMFSDVLVALRRAKSVDGILVVTADNGAAQIAGGHGAAALDANEDGHNPAAALGIGWARESGADRVLLVPGDCPLLVPDQLDELIGRPAEPRSVLIVPDRHGDGTNALLLSPPDSLAPAFGPGSRERHFANARTTGVAPEVVEVPSLALDVDTPEDLATLQEVLASMHGAAANTRGMLSQLLRSRL